MFTVAIADREVAGDLVSHRVEVFSLERGAPASAVRRPDLESLAELLGRDKCSRVALVTGSAATPPPRRRWRRSPLGLDSEWIGRGRPRGVGRVQVELLLQLSDSLLQRSDDSHNGHLGFRRNGAPERIRDRRVRAHTTDSTSLLYKMYKMFEPVNAYSRGLSVMIQP
jgi:hypothetical protein